MAEPEIARHCPACGASIRDRAFFCPQCGAEVSPTSSNIATETPDEEMSGVEKLLEISSTVIDEAAYDPSLRFVLVAAVLFVLFVVILIFSELIT